MRTEQWLLSLQAPEYAVVIPTRDKNVTGWADCVDRFIWIVKQTDLLYIVHVRAIVGPSHLGQQNVTSARINSVWLVYNHVNIDTY